MGDYRLDLLARIEALDELLADAQSEARSHADAAGNYARELSEARALIRELVEALREIEEMPDDPPEDYASDAPDWLLYSRERAINIARSARLKARAAGYTEEGE